MGSSGSLEHESRLENYEAGSNVRQSGPGLYRKIQLSARTVDTAIRTNSVKMSTVVRLDAILKRIRVY